MTPARSTPVLSKPKLEAESVDAVEVVFEQPLALAEAQPGVEIQRPLIRHFCLQNHLRTDEPGTGNQPYTSSLL